MQLYKFEIYFMKLNMFDHYGIFLTDQLTHIVEKLLILLIHQILILI